MIKKRLLILISLVMLTNLTAAQTTETVLLQGQVMDTAGNPIAGAVVEIWQTDINGNYDHPNDSDPSLLVDNFQYFGTATSDVDGYYAFLTIKPAPYEPRPAHIHFKVKFEGQTVLTSQFYFLEDFEDVQTDGAFANGGDTLFLQPEDSTDAADNPIRIATGNIVLVVEGVSGDLTPTAAQTEGPYYPVVDFSDYDNNLLSTADDDEAITPMLAETEFTLLNLNTASGDDFKMIPNVGDRMVREFQEYRPYISIVQFRREIGKYVDANQVAAYEAYVYVPVNVDESDAATLMQISGVDEDTANALMAARPFGSNAAFLEALGAYLSPADVQFAANYLAAE